MLRTMIPRAKRPRLYSQRPGPYRRYSMRLIVPHAVFRIIGRIRPRKINWDTTGKD